MAKRAKKGSVIKIDLKQDGTYQRDSWYGIGEFKAKVNEDKTLTVGLPDHDVQVCPLATNDVGEYYSVKAFGGNGFATLVDNEYGKYLRIKLGDNVKLPAAVVEKINYKPKAAGGTPKRAQDNTDYWGS